MIHQKDWEKMTEQLDDLRQKIFNEGINGGNWDKIRKDFVEIWTPERVENMTLEEYTDTNREYSFTYWLENVLNDFGNIHGSTAIKFGVYLGFDGKYRWKKSLGDNENEAFKVVKEKLKEIIDYSQKGELDKIDEIWEISPMFKWKVAFLYNGENNNILPIYSWDKLLEICENQEIKIEDDDSYPELYKKLLDKKRENIDIFEYFYELWNNDKNYNDNIGISIYQIVKYEDTQKNYELLQIKSNKDDENLFSWDEKKFKNVNIGDLIFFVNPSKGEILITKLINRGFRLDLKNKRIIKGNIKYNLDGDNVNSLSNFKDSEFIIFEILEKKKEVSFKNWVNIGSGSFTFVREFDDKRLIFILNKNINIENKILDNLNKNYKKILNKDVDLKTYFGDFLWGRFFDEKYANSNKNFEKLFLGIKNIDLYLNIRFIEKNNNIKENKYEKIIYFLLQNIFESIILKKYLNIENSEFKDKIIELKDNILLNDYGITIDNLESIYFSNTEYSNKDTLDDFLLKVPNFDYIYIVRTLDFLSKIIFDFNNKEKDQKSYNIGLLGKWGKGKSTILGLLKEKLKKEGIFNIYEIDVWKGYSNIGNRGEDKFGFIKYMLEKLLEQVNIGSKIVNFFTIKYLKNKFYNNIHIGNQYYITFWIVIFSLITSVYLLTINKINFIGDLLNLKFFSGIPGIFHMGNILNIGLLMLFIYFFLSTLIKNANKTKIYDKQITDLNLARKDAEKVEKILNFNIDFLDLFLNIFSVILISIIFIFIGTILSIWLIPIFNFTIEHFGKKCIAFIFILFFIFFCIKKGCNNFGIRKNKDKKNIIILENVDRLNPDQILDVLDLTKTVLDFKNTIYIIPIDHYLIYEGLKIRYEKSEFDPIEYIDKIINFPFFIINPFLNNIPENYKDFLTYINKKKKKFSSLETSKNDYSKYFGDKFIRTIISKDIPRKENIFRDILGIYGDIFNLGIEYYNMEGNNKNKVYQRLFLFFLSLRYSDFKLFLKIENDISILNKVFITLDDINKFLSEKRKEENILDFNNNIEYLLYLISKRDYEIGSVNLINKLGDIDINDFANIVILLKQFYTIDVIRSYLLELSIDDIKGYMERVFVPISIKYTKKLQNQINILS